MLPDLTKTGATYRERYIIPTVLVPPTESVEEAGAGVFQPTPGSTNRGSGVLTLGGQLRQVTGNAPTIVLTVQGLGLSRRGGAVLPLVSINRANSIGPNDGAGPPQVQAKLTRSFDLHSSYNFRPTTADLTGYYKSTVGIYFGTATYDAPMLLGDSNGTFLSMLLVRETGNIVRADAHSLMLHAYTPGVDAAWRRVAFGWLDDLLGVSGSTYTNIIASAIAQHPNGTVYVAFGGYTASASDGSKLYIAALNGSTADTTVDNGAWQLVSGPLTITTGRVSSASMCFLPTTAALVAFGVIDYDPTVTTITGRRTLLLQSPDLRTWDTAGGNVNLPEVASTSLSAAPLLPVSELGAGSAGRFVAYARGDATHAWAVSEEGQIVTISGAGSMSAAVIPRPDVRKATIRFHAVAAASDGASGFYVYAAGEIVSAESGAQGIIYKSTDSGATWEVIPTWPTYDWFEESELTYSPDTRTWAPSDAILPIYGIAMKDHVTGWFVGAKSQILYTTNGGNTFTRVRTMYGAASARLTSVVHDTGAAILVAGEAQDSDELTTATNRLCRAIHIANATTAIAVNDAANTYYLAQAAGDEAPVTSLSRGNATSTTLINAAAYTYAVTSAGKVQRGAGTGSAITWTTIATLPLGPQYAAVGALVGTPATVYVAGSMSRYLRPRGGSGRFVPTLETVAFLWRSTDATGGSPAFTSLARVGGTFAAIAVTGAAAATIVGGSQLWSLVPQVMHTFYPAVITCPDGSVLYARANITLGAVEVYRAPDSNLAFELVDRSVFFTASTPDSMSSATLAPHFAVDQNGDILLLAGTSSRMSSDNGQTWYVPIAPDSTANAPLPLGALASATDYTTALRYNARHSFARMGQQRVWSSREKDSDGGGNPTETMGIFVSRDWSTSGTDYLPALDVPQWLGIDGLTFHLQGSPPIGDYWTVATVYQYGKANFTLYETPSVRWRSKSDQAELVVQWDRTHADVEDIDGDGLFWDASAFALFGSTFRNVYFGVSDPTNDASFSEVQSLLSVDDGTCANVGARISDVLACYSTYPGTPKVWTPGHWNAGMRQYFVAVAGATNIGGSTTANASTTIAVGAGTGSFLTKLTPGDEIALSSATTAYATVVSIESNDSLTVGTALGDGTSQTINKRERVFRIKRNTASHLTIEGLCAIASTTTYIVYGDRHAWCSTTWRDGTGRFGRYVRLRIPAQATPDKYAQLGTPIIGIEPPPDSEGRSFAYGFSWAPVVNTTQERALTGVTSVEHHGRLGQVWGLRYAAEKREAVLRKLQVFGNALRRPFALLFHGAPDATTAAEGAELVRLTDAQKYQNLLGDRYDDTHALEEVV